MIIDENVIKLFEDIRDVLVAMNNEINKLTQEIIKLNERIEDATAMQRGK